MSSFVIVGPKTTIPFYREIVSEPDFLAGKFDTGYFDSHPGIFDYMVEEREEDKLVKLLSLIHHQKHNPFAM